MTDTFPLLVKVTFTHYAPRDAKEGVEDYLIANDMGQALAYIDHEYLNGAMADWENDGDEDSYCPDEEWWNAHPDKKAEAASLGLEVDQHGDVSGRSAALTKFLCGTGWGEVNEAYYGVTHYDWSESKTTAPETATLLLVLGIATDIRNWSKPK